MSKNQHVVPHDKGWAVKGEGNSKNYRVTDTQKEAIKIAQSIAKNQKSELYIHGSNGTISEKKSYGNNPASPKARK